MKKRYKVLIGLGIVVICYLIIQLLPLRKVSENNLFINRKSDLPLVIAHGGSKELFPENTMLAFDESFEIGVDVLEMDICITKDGILVTHHDETIDRTSDGSGKVSDYTYSDLLSFNFGANFTNYEGKKPYEDEFVSIATVEDVLLKYKDDVLFSIEIKDEGELGKKAADELYRILVKYNMTDIVMVSNFDDEIVNYFRKISDNKILTSTGKQATTTLVIFNKLGLDILHTPKHEAMQIPLKESGIDLSTKGMIKTAKKRNMAIIYWTINDEDEMRKLIDMKVDGIITDRPDLLNKILNEYR